MQCLQMCVSEFIKREGKGAEQGEESGGLPEPVEEAQDVLQSLVDRMAETSLEDFELVSGRVGWRREETCTCLAVLC